MFSDFRSLETAQAKPNLVGIIKPLKEVGSSTLNYRIKEAFIHPSILAADPKHNCERICLYKKPASPIINHWRWAKIKYEKEKKNRSERFKRNESRNLWLFNTPGHPSGQPAQVIYLSIRPSIHLESDLQTTNSKLDNSKLKTPIWMQRRDRQSELITLPV